MYVLTRILSSQTVQMRPQQCTWFHFPQDFYEENFKQQDQPDSKVQLFQEMKQQFRAPPKDDAYRYLARFHFGLPLDCGVSYHPLPPSTRVPSFPQMKALGVINTSSFVEHTHGDLKSLKYSQLYDAV